MRGAPTGKDNQPGSGDADPGSPEGDGGGRGGGLKEGGPRSTNREGRRGNAANTNYRAVPVTLGKRPESPVARPSELVPRGRPPVRVIAYQRSRVTQPPACDGGYRSEGAETTDAGRRTT